MNGERVGGVLVGTRSCLSLLVLHPLLFFSRCGKPNSIESLLDEL